ncbi:MAG: UDP-N-acetylmuramoyl-L-alanine--D-glutamate ligase [Bacteroidales bacterium]
MQQVSKKIAEYFRRKKVLICGFGREGKSTYRMLTETATVESLAVADRNGEVMKELASSGVTCYEGPDYLDKACLYDIVMLTPGIPHTQISGKVMPDQIRSQTSVMLELAGKNIIGVTGTKGKSTTSVLITEMLRAGGKKPLLVGNIGKPPFDYLSEIRDDTLIVFELSAHQLEWVKNSPDYAVLLNLYQEHLDHFGGYERYREAKFNLIKFIHATGHIWTTEIALKEIKNVLQEIPGQLHIIPQPEQGSFFLELPSGPVKVEVPEGYAMRGRHNLLNVSVSASVAHHLGVSKEVINRVVRNFKGLPHRLEYLGCYAGIHIYNDSIATIPQATVAALESLDKVDTLILGGYDRGIDYKLLIDYLSLHPVPVLLLTGPAGERIGREVSELNLGDTQLIFMKDFDELSYLIPEHTPVGGTCLLSPAAASYDRFMNFEQRGDALKKIAESISLSAT